MTRDARPGDYTTFNTGEVGNLAKGIVYAGADDVTEELNRLAAELAEARRVCDSFKQNAFTKSRRQMLGTFPEAYSDDELAMMFEPWWHRHETDGLSPREVRLLETIADRNLQLAKSVITCVFCGSHYKHDGNDPAELRAHILECKEHPLGKLRGAMNEIERGATDDLAQCPINTVAWGNADGRREAIRTLRDVCMGNA